MGLLRAEIMEIISILLKYKNPSVLMLGKQDIYTDAEDILLLIKKYGYDVIFDTHINNDENMIDSFKLFKALGAEEVHALDCSEYEGADVIFNLNEKDLPCDLYDKYDLIIDGGVLEHIFQPGNALDNITKMLRRNGTIYHMVPCAGLIDHGFYSFSPTFFLDYYEKVGFNVDSIRMQYKPERGAYKFVFYSMDCRLFLRQEGFNRYIENYWNAGGEIMLQCIVTKNRNISLKEQAVPLQTRYKEIYGE